jgi:leishmanolysin-like peptidase
MALCLLAQGLAAGADSTVPPPHIITIPADDMGWYDSAINNPESFMAQQGFGALTRGGIKPARHHAYKYCSPSRRPFLSGRFPNHISGAQAPICSNFLPLEFTLMPAKLKAAGYATHMLGKGHLGYMTTNHLPVNRGFDSHIGYLAAGEGYNWGNTGPSDSTPAGQAYCSGSNSTATTGCCKKGMWHDQGTGWGVVDDIANSTDFCTQHVVQLIRAHGPSRPFYLHLTYQAVHNPFKEPPLSAQIPSGSAWWDQTSWGSVLNSLDKGIANVTAALVARGMWNNTLVVLVSDNGGLPSA